MINNTWPVVEDPYNQINWEHMIGEHVCCYSDIELREVRRKIAEEVWDEAAACAPEYMPKNPYRKNS